MPVQCVISVIAVPSRAIPCHPVPSRVLAFVGILWAASAGSIGQPGPVDPVICVAMREAIVACPASLGWTASDM